MARGLVCQDLEFVVERLMQYFKNGTGRNVSKNPEKVFVGWLMLGRALREIKARHPGIADVGPIAGPVLPVPAAGEGMAMGGGVAPRAARFRGAADEGDQAQLLGTGQPVVPGMRASVRNSVRRYVNALQPEGWGPADLEACVQKVGREGILEFKQGMCNEHLVSAEGFGKSVRRSNIWVKVRWQSRYGVLTPKVCRVLRFVLVPHPRLSLHSLRLAICAVYKPMQSVQPLLKVNASSQLDEECIAVPVSNVDCKLVCNWPEGYKVGIMYFMPDSTMTDR